jgi:deoxyribonuclease IV
LITGTLFTSIIFGGFIIRPRRDLNPDHRLRKPAFYPSYTTRALFTYEKSKHMLKDNINNCNMLNIDYLIIHLGSHKGKGIEYGIERVSNALNEVLGSTENVNILLENGSGYNNSVGSKFEEIGAIVDNLQSKRIGVCFDTCHAFAAGYDLRTEEAVDKTINEFDSFVSLSRLRLVHLNDAKYELGSGLDRHWNIGKGYIGRKGFLSLFKNRSFHDGSFVMETPVKEPDDHEKDMKTIKSIINDAIE